MSLVDAPSDKNLKIVAIPPFNRFRNKLNSLGLHIDDSIIKLNDTRWGPVLIQGTNIGSLKLALGRGLAEKIEVDYAE